MRPCPSLALYSALLTLFTVPALASPHVRRGPTAPRLHVHTARAAAHVSSPKTGIAPERATAIQAALIKAGYLSGTPSGVWDASSQAAMEKLQAENGWQTKIVPDSRAIIKLGLGPNTGNFHTAEATSSNIPETSSLFAGDTTASHTSDH